MLKAIENSFSKLSFSIQKAIAPNPLLAKALAYFANGTIVNNSCKTYIEHLPIEALFIDSAITDELDDLGVVTIGALLKLPQGMLIKRFGIKLIQRIDQLRGGIEWPLTYLEEKPQFIYSEHFTSPIRTHECFVNVANLLIEKALGHLVAHYFSLLSMTIWLTDTLKNTIEITISSSCPTNNFKHWCELLLLKAQDLSFNDGIDNIKLELTQFDRTKPQQSHFSQQFEHHIQSSFITDKLRSRLGQDAVFHLRITERHMPEYGVMKDFVLTKKLDQAPRIKLPPRPLRLFERPIPINVIAMLPDNPPAKIMWKQHSFNILHAVGPERIENEWWSNINEPYRDYFYIEDERGKRLWVYSSGEPKSWFIHGVFA